jgi:SAM-dependent methyltransferase
MTDDEPSGHTYLDVNAPLSDARMAALIETLRPLDGATVLDLGCGWAELLLRLLAAEPSARGLGVDTDEDALARGRANAATRGLADRVRLENRDVHAVSEPADAVLAIGAGHAWGGSAGAVQAVRALTRPGGRVLLGEAVWDRPPTPAALRALDAEPGDFGTVAELADLAMASGLRLLALSVATLDEWDDFESRYCAGRERWLLAHPGHPDADRVRQAVDDHRRGWLHGYRGILGFAYLTLARP